MAHTFFLAQYNTSEHFETRRAEKIQVCIQITPDSISESAPNNTRFIVVFFSDPSRILCPFPEICYDRFFLNPFQFATCKYAHLMRHYVTIKISLPKRWRRQVFSFPELPLQRRVIDKK
jgi:hypothetical protein